MSKFGPGKDSSSFEHGSLRINVVRIELLRKEMQEEAEIIVIPLNENAVSLMHPFHSQD